MLLGMSLVEGVTFSCHFTKYIISKNPTDPNLILTTFQKKMLQHMRSSTIAEGNARSILLNLCQDVKLSPSCRKKVYNMTIYTDLRPFICVISFSLNKKVATFFFLEASQNEFLCSVFPLGGVG